jgi:ubiquinone/menaquinone biosynthesis C-methylase UbiE
VTLANSYRRLAPIYDWVAAVPFARARRASLARIPPAGRLDVLLSGVGTGLDFAHLPRCHRYSATDLVAAMLARARARIDDLDIGLARADSMRLPFADASFDVVVLHLIVAVVANPVAALKEAARVTRGAGTVLLLDKFLPRGRRALVRRCLSPLAGRMATRLDVVFEELLVQVPQLTVVADQPALAGGWFRCIALKKTP